MRREKKILYRAVPDLIIRWNRSPFKQQFCGNKCVLSASLCSLEKTSLARNIRAGERGEQGAGAASCSIKKVSCLDERAG
ncbi:MAG: hypothetical protein L6365_17415, partial [Desulfobulbaceae bacterium]|nr:hypothetical protein [Pseudomonadota bacterium]MCG2749295.1 hypothetical protein [Desulfobulbaceae bacterium]